jgi:hypothetical protein
MAWVATTYAKWLKDRRLGRVLCQFYNDTPITMTRNRAVKDALAAGSDYLLMIDSDIVPDISEPGSRPFWKTAWEFLMRRREKERGESLLPATIAAPYCGPPPHENIFVFHWTDWETDSPDRAIALQQYTRAQAASFRGIAEVHALPTGLILYDLRLFNHLHKPWFDYEYEDEEKAQKCTTEDVYQTRNAALLGFPQFCAWDSWAGHVKSKLVRKPHPICMEDVEDRLADAILSKHSRFDKVVFVGEDEPWSEIIPALSSVIDNGHG